MWPEKILSISLAVKVKIKEKKLILSPMQVSITEMQLIRSGIVLDVKLSLSFTPGIFTYHT